MEAAHLDLESGSYAPLPKCGPAKYFEHPSTRIHGFRYRVPGSKVIGEWRYGQPFPRDLYEHVAAGGIITAHNAGFERNGWNRKLRKYFPFLPELKPAQMDCTQARAAVLAIPTSLDVAARVLNVKQRKADGSAMKAMMTPTGSDQCHICSGAGCDTCEHTGQLFFWKEDEATYAANMAYCAQDVLTEEDIDRNCPRLSERERRIWELDQTINDRGLRFDLPTVLRAIPVREIAKRKLHERMDALTGGVVKKTSQAKALARWITDLGVPCDSVAKGEVEELKADVSKLDTVPAIGLVCDWSNKFHASHGRLPTLAEAISEALDIRAAGNKSSAAKLDAMVAACCDDWRAYGLLRYHGASTSRWAGALIQPQNFPRVDLDDDGHMLLTAIQFLHQYEPEQAHDLIELLCGPVLEVLSKMLRLLIVPAEGKKFVGADLTNIEGRMAAWAAEEEWKLEAFRTFDTLTGRLDKKGLPERAGPDLYIVAYARSFGVETGAVTRKQRQIGKVMELAFGYQGGVGSFINMAAVYGMKIPDLVAPVRAAVTEDEWYAMAAKYKSDPRKYGLPIDQWTACKLLVKAWREAHPKLVQCWWDLQDAAIEAVANPGVPVRVMNGRVAYVCSNGFLWCQKPSGGVLAYANPRVQQRYEALLTYPDGEVVDASTWAQQAIMEEAAKPGVVLKEDSRKRVVAYDGWVGEKKLWGALTLYGGEQFNHVIQGSARDVLADGMFDLEAAGYPVVMTVHDENLTEVPLDFGSAAEVEQIMSKERAWLRGCPLAAKGWEGVRYGK